MVEPYDDSMSKEEEKMLTGKREFNKPIQADLEFGKKGEDRLKWMLKFGLPETNRTEIARRLNWTERFFTDLFYQPKDTKRPKKFSRKLLRELSTPLSDIVKRKDGNEENECG